MASQEAPDPWDEVADGWDDEAAVRAYAAAAYESLTAVLADRGLSLAGATVCDFGCGTGLLTERLSGSALSIDAVDSSAAMLAQLAAKIERGDLPNVRPLSSLPSTVESHDVVVCSSVLGFVDDYPATAAALSRLLRPSGLFVQWDWERDDSDDDPDGLSSSEIAGALSAAGLTAVDVRTAFEITVDGATMRPLIGIGQKGSP